MRILFRRSVCLCFGLLIIAQSVFGQTLKDDFAAYNEPSSRFRGMIEKFGEDYGILSRFYTAQTSANRSERFRRFYGDELELINRLDFASLNHDEQIDYLLFRNYLEHEQKELAREAAQLAEMAPLMPFAKVISDLEDTRRRLETIDSAKTAALLTDLSKDIAATQKSFDGASAVKPKRTVANRAVRTVGGLRNTLRNWYTFHNAYDPMFTWWNAEPYKSVDEALQKYQAFISEKLVGIKADDKVTIIGDPNRALSFDRGIAVRDDSVHA